MLQPYPRFFLSQPVIYFGDRQNSNDHNEQENSDFEIRFDLNSSISSQNNIGLFIDWYDLPEMGDFH